MAWAAISAAGRHRAGTPASSPVDDAAIEAQLRRSRRWRTTPDLLALRPTASGPPIEITPSPETDTSWRHRGQPYSVSFLTSVVVHLWLFVAAALVTVAATNPPTRVWLVAEAVSLDEVQSERVVEIIAPLAEITDDAFAPELSVVATFSTAKIDPGEMAQSTPKIELVDVQPFASAGLASGTTGSPDTSGSGAATSGDGDAGSGGDPNGDQDAEFFGVKASGERFVFVCDCSRSMAGPKWLELHRELARSIEQLGPARSFYIIFFDGEMHPMFEPLGREPSLLPATSENVQKTRQWLSLAALGPNTSPYESIKFALSLEPDAIFLLTDGEFEDYTAPYLRDFHRQRKKAGETLVTVHTIGLFEKKHQLVLKRIARDSGGTYRFVAELTPATH